MQVLEPIRPTRCVKRLFEDIDPATSAAVRAELKAEEDEKEKQFLKKYRIIRVLRSDCSSHMMLRDKRRHQYSCLHRQINDAFPRDSTLDDEWHSKTTCAFSAGSSTEAAPECQQGRAKPRDAE